MGWWSNGGHTQPTDGPELRAPKYREQLRTPNLCARGGIPGAADLQVGPSVCHSARSFLPPQQHGLSLPCLPLQYSLDAHRISPFRKRRGDRPATQPWLLSRRIGSRSCLARYLPWTKAPDLATPKESPQKNQNVRYKKRKTQQHSRVKNQVRVKYKKTAHTAASAANDV